MLGVAMDDLLSLDVGEIIFQNLLTKEVDERLNILRHFVHILTGSQLTEVDLGERSLEELDVKFITNIIVLHIRMPTYLKKTATSSMGSSTPRFLSMSFPS